MTLFLWRHKDYVTENTSSKWSHKNFPILSPSLSKILVAPLFPTSTAQNNNSCGGSQLSAYEKTPAYYILIHSKW